MGYRVEYRPVKKVRRMEKRTVRLPALTALFFLLFLLLVNSIWPRGTEVLRGLAFSGDAAVTADALDVLAMELRAGEALPSALETFCRKVMGENGIVSG